jgi:hypothetical protein
MKKLILFVLSFSALAFASAQIVPQKICTLPSVLAESSGLLKTGANRFFSHNDSGSDPVLTEFDSSGTVKRRLYINASNVDWEDITTDVSGKVYIGEFGNNNNDRKNLRIYIMANPSTFTKDTTSVGILNFTYQGQTAFPPAAEALNYDMEAMFWWNDSIFLFSKNRTSPYNGYTVMYALPAKAGTYVAAKRDSFYTGAGAWLNQSITGAAISQDGKKVVLLGYDKLWLFKGYTGNKFLKGQVNTYTFNALSQKEGICFADSNTLYFTEESSPLSSASLFRFKLPNQSSGLQTKKKEINDFNIYPNPFQQKLCIQNPTEKKLGLMLLDMNGTKIIEKEISSKEICLEDEISALNPGNYLIGIIENNKVIYSEKVSKY